MPKNGKTDARLLLEKFLGTAGATDLMLDKITVHIVIERLRKRVDRFNLQWALRDAEASANPTDTLFRRLARELSLIEMEELIDRIRHERGEYKRRIE